MPQQKGPSSPDTFLTMHSYKVYVRVEGEDLPVYAPAYDRKNHRATDWIASRAGKTFSVIMKQAQRFKYTTAADLYLDGSKVYDDIFIDDIHTNIKPGTIEVRMSRVRIIETGLEESWNAYAPYPVLGDDIIHEKSAKAGSHVAKLGDEIASDNVRIFTVPLGPRDKEPWVLRAIGIIPKSKSKAKSTAKISARPSCQNPKARESAKLAVLETSLQTKVSALGSRIAYLNYVETVREGGNSIA
ncbi:hypothetical protein FRB90_011222 [Tulasnella sp. 427]|nr:hypothetical protein FRB90_011222 [Tulasnella sp. 427]